jgi:hypothetical protein
MICNWLFSAGSFPGLKIIHTMCLESGNQEGIKFLPGFVRAFEFLPSISDRQMLIPLLFFSKYIIFLPSGDTAG